MAKSTLTKNQGGRPKGSKDKKPRKRKLPGTKASRSAAAKKAAETRRRKREEKAAAMKPAIERPDVKVTPYPRAGDDPAFQAVLDRAAASAEQAKAERTQQQEQSAGPEEPEQLLSESDVREWVAWPFMLWAQANGMESLLLSAREAESLAEPLTSILNRHGVGSVLPPDAVDALRLGARITPVMAERFSQIKHERQKRAGHGGPRNPERGTEHGGAARPVQGAAISEPKER